MTVLLAASESGATWALLVLCIGGPLLIIAFGLLARAMAGREENAATKEELVSLAGELGLEYVDREERNMSDIATRLKIVPDEDYTSAGCLLSGERDGVRIAIFVHVCEPPDPQVRHWQRDILDRMGGIGALMSREGGRSTGPDWRGGTIRTVCSVGIAFSATDLPSAVLRPRPIRPWPFSLLTSDEEREADAENLQFGRVYEAEGPGSEEASGLLTHEVRALLCNYPQWNVELDGNVLAICTGQMWPLENYRQAVSFLPAMVKAVTLSKPH